MNLRGGAVSLPVEYFGGSSGLYSQDPNIGYEPHAYGAAVPVSHGVIHGNSTGPNLHVMPNSSMLQTGGGRRHLLKTKVNQFIKKMKKSLKIKSVRGNKKKSVRGDKKKSVRGNKKKSVRGNKKKSMY